MAAQSVNKKDNMYNNCFTKSGSLPLTKGGSLCSRKVARYAHEGWLHERVVIRKGGSLPLTKGGYTKGWFHEGLFGV